MGSDRTDGEASTRRRDGVVETTRREPHSDPRRGTDWRAVATGFAVGIFVQIVAAVTVLDVGILGTTAGGFVAGYLAGGRLARGAWHGFLTAAIWLLVVLPLFAIGVFAVASFDVIPPVLTLGGILLFAVVGLVLAFVSVVSAGAGALGATMSRA